MIKGKLGGLKKPGGIGGGIKKSIGGAPLKPGAIGVNTTVKVT